MAAAAVLVCVFNLLGRSIPDVILLDSRPPDVSRYAEAFVRRNPVRIYLLTDTDVFQDARRGDVPSLRKLASILIHEEWHVRHGPDERGAYQAQLFELLRLGEHPDRPTYRGVHRAMLFVTKAAL